MDHSKREDLAEKLIEEVLDAGDLAECENTSDVFEYIREWAIREGLTHTEAVEFSTYIVDCTDLIDH